MKKIFGFTVAFLFVASLSFAATTSVTASVVFASAGMVLHADETTASASTALVGKLSTGVGIGMKYDDTGYSMITQHKNGSKAYGSSYDSTSIFSTDITVGTPYATALTASDTADFSAWKAM